MDAIIGYCDTCHRSGRAINEVKDSRGVWLLSECTDRKDCAIAEQNYFTKTTTTTTTNVDPF